MTDDLMELLDNPEEIGRMVGFTDLTPLHGEWIREIKAALRFHALAQFHCLRPGGAFVPGADSADGHLFVLHGLPSFPAFALVPAGANIITFL